MHHPSKETTIIITPTTPLTSDTGEMMSKELYPLILKPRTKQQQQQTTLYPLSPFEESPSPEVESSYRYKLFNLLENPMSSYSAMMVTAIVCLAIIGSTLIVTIESLPEFHTGDITLLWSSLEVATVIFLSFEFCAR
jgi:hypothetical protein